MLRQHHDGFFVQQPWSWLSASRPRVCGAGVQGLVIGGKEFGLDAQQIAAIAGMP
jgi:hypothetical protein